MNLDYNSECFEPDLSEYQSLIIGFGLIILLALVSLAFSFRIKDVKASYRHLWQLFSAFLLVISMGIIVFSGWMYLKLMPLCLNNQGLSIGQKSYDKKDVNRIYIHKEQIGNNLVQVGQAGFFRILVVDVADKQYIFSEQHYPIDLIFEKLNSQYDPN